MEVKVIIVVSIVVAITLLYKALPFRDTGNNKPLIPFFPKYKKIINKSFADSDIEQKLAEYGFKKTNNEGNVINFSRGSVLGDISIRLAKVKIGIKTLDASKSEVTIQAGWVAAFDTGDHWKFITELCQKLENA